MVPAGLRERVPARGVTGNRDVVLGPVVGVHLAVPGLVAEPVARPGERLLADDAVCLQVAVVLPVVGGRPGGAAEDPVDLGGGQVAVGVQHLLPQAGGVGVRRRVALAQGAFVVPVVPEGARARDVAVVDVGRRGRGGGEVQAEGGHGGQRHGDGGAQGAVEEHGDLLESRRWNCVKSARNCSRQEPAGDGASAGGVLKECAPARPAGRGPFTAGACRSVAGSCQLGGGGPRGRGGVQSAGSPRPRSRLCCAPPIGPLARTEPLRPRRSACSGEVCTPCLLVSCSWLEWWGPASPPAPRTRSPAAPGPTCPWSPASPTRTSAISRSASPAG